MKEEGITRADFEFEMAWRISWQQFLKRTLTEEKLNNYYRNNRRQFDGTQLKVSHLLIKDAGALDKVEALSQQLSDDPSKWSTLVEQNSNSPSKSDGGLIGWIGLDGPMPVVFSRAAFRLKQGEISKPVKTDFGWHLIRCNEVKPGKLGIKDAYEKVYAGASKVVFSRLAGLQRKTIQIDYAADWPHLDENGQLVAPKLESKTGSKNKK